jgi:hypothetical protein
MSRKREGPVPYRAELSGGARLVQRALGAATGTVNVTSTGRGSQSASRCKQQDARATARASENAIITFGAGRLRRPG